MRLIVASLLILLGATLQGASAGEKPIRVMAPISLGQMHQELGESEHAFLVRVSKHMRDYTARTGFEVCGDLCRGPKGQAITLFTEQSHVMCPSMKGCPLTAPSLENIFIHTHPQINYIQLNAVDAAHYNVDRKIFKVKAGKSIPVSPRRFSGDDYEVGPGYMIYRNEVYYQEGRGTQRLAFTLDP